MTDYTHLTEAQKALAAAAEAAKVSPWRTEEFFQAADPTTILALLADLSAARAALAAVRAAYLRELDDATVVGVTGIVGMIDRALEDAK